MLRKIIFGRKKLLKKILAKEYDMSPEEYTNIDFAKDRMDEIKIYLKECMEDKCETVDEVTWNDLNMDDIFLKLNHTRSFIGEQVLYKELATISDEPFVSEEHISYFSNYSDKRIIIEQMLQGIGKQKDDYYLPMIIFNPGIWRISGGWIFNMLQILLFVFFVISLATKSTILIVATIAVGITNLTISMFTKNKYDSLLFSIGCIKQMICLSEYIIKDKDLRRTFLNEDLQQALKIANEISRYISGFQIRKNYNMIGDGGGLFLDYLMGITLYDIVSFNSVIRKLDKHKDDMLLLYKLVGKLDAEIAVASFRHRTKNWCVPETSSNGIISYDLIHPVVNNCISNSIIIENGVILTGANASGKSTFMKALAVNSLLAQTINTACAKKFAIPYRLRVMSSMALRDDIISGESYYIREINQLKNMIDKINEDTPIFILIDEILKGTNSLERVAASYGILGYLIRENVYIVVATHDISLVELVKDEYKCYYFGSDIVNGELKLDYKLHKGINSKSNAIQLLELSDFPQEIIKQSKLYLNKSAV